MKIYLSHSRHFGDYEKNLYEPIRNSDIYQKHTFFFPHEKSDKPFDSKDLIKNKKIDMVLAEVSYPATGQGIELGWADDVAIPIICIYKKGADVAGSLKVVSEKFIEYDDSVDLVNKLENSIQ